MAHKAWVFTLNNYDFDEEVKIQDYLTNNCQWGAYGHEVGDSGTPHLQGAFVLLRRRTLLAIKRHMPRAHLEPMRGTPYESKQYAEKDNEGVWSVGQLQKPGMRNDMEAIKKLYLAGTSEKQIIMDHCHVPAHFHLLNQMRKEFPKQRPVEPREVIWIHGCSGSGKTHTANELALERTGNQYESIWWRHQEGNWAEGYCDQPVAVLDDIDEKTYEFKHLLRMLDKFPYSVAVKGGSKPWVANTVIITALDSPDILFRNLTPADLYQLNRRITQTISLLPRD